MKTLMKTTLFTILLAFGFNPLYAGGGHDHGAHGHSHDKATLSKVKAEKLALKNLSQLVSSGKVDKSWSDKSIFKIEKKKFHHSMEWVVSFKNEKITDKTKQMLYIFVNMHGEITGANYSGQ